MISYIIRRLLLLFPTLIGITLLVFFIMALSPGNVTTMLLSAQGEMRAEQRQQMERYIRERYGLGDPLVVQYGRWLNRISPVGFKRTPQPWPEDGLPDLQRRYDLHSAGEATSHERAVERLREDVPSLESVTLGADGKIASAVRAGEGWPRKAGFGLKVPDMGESFVKRRPVLDIILDALPITILLNLITIPIIYAVAVTAGIYAARHRGKAFDVASGTTFIGLYSMPVMWIGVMLLGVFASKDYLHWFPTGGLHGTMADSMTFLPRWTDAGIERGWLLDVAWHLVLPIICLTYGGFAFLSKLMRAAVLENISADFARTARAKGLSERVVLFRHVVSNSILPLITVAASILPGLLGGSLIVESIFSINGMGRLMIDAIKMKDQELVLSEICVVALISLVSLIVADICYALADPRVTYE